MSIAWITFNKAMVHLSGPGPQRERLLRACSPTMLGMKRKEIPQEVRAEFDALIQLMGSDWERHSCPVSDMVRALSDPQVVQAAGRILAIYDQLTRYQPATDVQAGDKPRPRRGLSPGDELPGQHN